MRKILCLIFTLLFFTSCSLLKEYKITEQSLNSIVSKVFTVEKNIGPIKVKAGHVNTSLKNEKIYTKANINLNDKIDFIGEFSYNLKIREDNKLYLENVELVNILNKDGESVFLNNIIVKSGVNYIISYLLETPIYDFDKLHLPLGKVVKNVKVVNDNLIFLFQ